MSHVHLPSLIYSAAASVLHVQFYNCRRPFWAEASCSQKKCTTCITLKNHSPFYHDETQSLGRCLRENLAEWAAALASSGVPYPSCSDYKNKLVRCVTVMLFVLATKRCRVHSFIIHHQWMFLQYWRSFLCLSNTIKRKL